MGDFNRDGKLDIAAVGANPNGPGWLITRFSGDGDGTFRSTGSVFSSIRRAAWAALVRVFTGDFNRDGNRTS